MAILGQFRSPGNAADRVAIPTTFSWSCPGEVPGIHDFCGGSQDVDGRDKPGHDAELVEGVS
jgi:hypothetical protein